MEKLSQNCAQPFLRNKYRYPVFAMGGTVSFRSPIPTFLRPESYRPAANYFPYIDSGIVLSIIGKSII